MTPIDYLLLAGAVLAGGYVVARLFTGWIRSSETDAESERDGGRSSPITRNRTLEPIAKTGAPWHYRK